MDRQISSSEQRKTNLKKWVRILLIIGVVALAFFLLRRALTKKVDKDTIRFATVERGEIENTIMASGLIVPAFEQQINSPINTEIKGLVLTSGANVKKGDLIMELDQEFIQLEYEGLKDQLELRKNNITRLRLEYDKNLKDLEYNDQIKALELSSLEADLADAKRLKKVGGATQEEVEQAELRLKIAKLEKKKLENDLNFNKKAITSDRRNLELEVLIQEKKLRELSKKLTQTAVTAPRSGVITWLNEDIGKKVLEGEALVRLADLESYRIEASVSDRYGNSVKVGLPVKVRINQTNLMGTITSILPAIENNTISFIVQLDDKSHNALRPNMQVEIFIISNKKDNVLRVKNGPAFSGAVNQEAFVVRGEEAVKVPIKVGLVNTNFIEITSQTLQEGDVLIISDVKDYEHLDRMEIKEQ